MKPLKQVPVAFCPGDIDIQTDPSDGQLLSDINGVDEAEIVDEEYKPHTVN